MSRPRHPAVVDCGSNSTRLWLADADGGVPVRREVVTRLGRGVDATGRLDDDRLDHCLQVVGAYADAWRARGIADHDAVVIATSAVRDAEDRARFFDGIRDVAGVEARVLTGEEEATASFRGAVDALDPPTPTLVVDIGGGSTELVVGHGDRATASLRAVSLQLGTVRLTERHLHGDPPSADQVAAARHDAQSTLVGGLRTIGAGTTSPGRVRAVVAVAGTATTLAAMDDATARDGTDGRVDHLHGHRLAAGDLTELTLDLLGRSVADRLARHVLDEGRADVIAAGAMILDTLVDLLGADHVVVSLADNLDGVAFGALDGGHAPGVPGPDRSAP